jgi:hypothetical protein
MAAMVDIWTIATGNLRRDAHHCGALGRKGMFMTCIFSFLPSATLSPSLIVVSNLSMGYASCYLNFFYKRKNVFLFFFFGYALPNFVI